MEAYMKKVILLAVLSSLFLSGCSVLDYLVEQDKLVHPEYVPAGPNIGAFCDEQCQADLKAYREKINSEHYVRVPQPDDPIEYYVEINGKTVTCRPGLNTGSLDGINHNVICN